MGETGLSSRRTRWRRHRSLRISLFRLTIFESPIRGALLVVSAAMRHGALQNLEKLKIHISAGGGKDVRELMDALKASGCARRLKNICLQNCEVVVDGIRTFADLLGEDGFPALKELRLSDDPGIKDVGVELLAEGLVKAMTTYLTVLDLDDVGMGDKGIAALASLVSQGRLKQLVDLNLRGNGDVTNQGIISFAKAIGAHGLPRLEEIEMRGLDNRKVTALGISALAHAINYKRESNPEFFCHNERGG